MLNYFSNNSQSGKGILQTLYGTILAVMNIEESHVIPTPPGLVQSLLAGFDAITNHIGLVLFPVFLDLFLWLGPHLSLSYLVGIMLNTMASMPGMNGSDSADLLSLNRDMWSSIADRLNFFAVMRTYPVGVPSLMVSILPLKSPQGANLIWQLPSLSYVLITSIGLTVGGLLVGTAYFDTVAQAALAGAMDRHQSIRQYLWIVSQVFLLSLLWFAIITALSIPGGCLMSAMSVGGMNAGRLGLLIAGGLIVWLIFPLLLSAHGIFVYHKKMWASVRDSVRLTRFTFPTTALLFLAILVLNEGLNVLWRIPGDSSWLLLIGVAGHGFVSTGLLAATFIYYRDASIWLEKMLQQLKFSTKK